MVGEGVVSVTDEWKEKLIDNLLNFAGTPKVSYLTRRGSNVRGQVLLHRFLKSFVLRLKKEVNLERLKDSQRCQPVRRVLSVS